MLREYARFTIQSERTFLSAVQFRAQFLFDISRKSKKSWNQVTSSGQRIPLPACPLRTQRPLNSFGASTEMSSLQQLGFWIDDSTNNVSFQLTAFDSTLSTASLPLLSHLIRIADLTHSARSRSGSSEIARPPVLTPFNHYLCANKISRIDRTWVSHLNAVTPTSCRFSGNGTTCKHRMHFHPCAIPTTSSATLRVAKRLDDRDNNVNARQRRERSANWFLIPQIRAQNVTLMIPAPTWSRRDPRCGRTVHRKCIQYDLRSIRRNYTERKIRVLTPITVKRFFYHIFL